MENHVAPADQEILSLLKDSDNPMERAMLSVMLQMTASLESNTKATVAVAEGFHLHVEEFKAHRKQFDEHVDEERALFNQGKGMQRMLTISVSGLGVIMSVIMAMGLYILNGHVAGLIHERDVNNDQEHRISTLESMPRITRGEFEDLRNRVFKIETQLDTHLSIPLVTTPKDHK